jgi:hypothetical protein
MVLPRGIMIFLSVIFENLDGTVYFVCGNAELPVRTLLSDSGASAQPRSNDGGRFFNIKPLQ